MTYMYIAVCMFEKYAIYTIFCPISAITLRERGEFFSCTADTWCFNCKACLGYILAIAPTSVCPWVCDARFDFASKVVSLSCACKKWCIRVSASLYLVYCSQEFHFSCSQLGSGIYKRYCCMQMMLVCLCVSFLSVCTFPSLWNIFIQSSMAVISNVGLFPTFTFHKKGNAFMPR